MSVTCDGARSQCTAAKAVVLYARPLNPDVLQPSSPATQATQKDTTSRQLEAIVSLTHSDMLRARCVGRGRTMPGTGTAGLEALPAPAPAGAAADTASVARGMPSG